MKADGRRLSLYGYELPTGTPGHELLRHSAPSAEMRFHPLRGVYAIYAPQRQDRTFQPKTAEDPLAPFVPGSAPTEIPFGDFEVAIFENRFTSLSFETDDHQTTRYASSRALGKCEVVVYSSEPVGNLFSVGQARRILLIEALIDRYQSLFKDGASYVMPFENRGERIGVTLPHPHGQIYAFAETPPPQAFAARAFASGYDLNADHASWEGAFDVTRRGELNVFCPPFARFPYETWIVPKFDCPGPWTMQSEQIEDLAYLLGDVVRRLDALFQEEMPYMMSFQAAPRGHAGPFQFTVQFFPILRDAGRQKFLASVEQFTGVFTVDVPPETAAQRLRELVA